MARGQSTEQVKEEIRRARAALQDDVAALDHKLHVEVPRRAKEQGARAAIALAGVGLAVAGLVLFGRKRRSGPQKRKRTR